VLRVQPLNAEELARFANIVHYIRHSSTVAALRTVLPSLPDANSGIYRYEEGDRIIVITLRVPQRGQEVAVRLEDLDMWLIEVEQN